MSYSEWEKMGFSKGTLHYMKENAEGDKPFTLNAHVGARGDMGWMLNGQHFVSQFLLINIIINGIIFCRYRLKEALHLN